MSESVRAFAVGDVWTAEAGRSGCRFFGTVSQMLTELHMAQSARKSCDGCEIAFARGSSGCGTASHARQTRPHRSL